MLTQQVVGWAIAMTGMLGPMWGDTQGIVFFLMFNSLAPLGGTRLSSHAPYGPTKPGSAHKINAVEEIRLLTRLGGDPPFCQH